MQQSCQTGKCNVLQLQPPCADLKVATRSTCHTRTRLAELGASLAGLPALVSFIKGSLTNPTASVQVAAAWALANAADAAASATSCPAHILTSIAEGESLPVVLWIMVWPAMNKSDPLWRLSLACSPERDTVMWLHRRERTTCHHGNAGVAACVRVCEVHPAALTAEGSGKCHMCLGMRIAS